MRIDFANQKTLETELRISGCRPSVRYNVTITLPVEERGPLPKQQHYNVGSSPSGDIFLSHPTKTPGVVKLSLSQILPGLDENEKPILSTPETLEYRVN